MEDEKNMLLGHGILPAASSRFGGLVDPILRVPASLYVVARYIRYKSVMDIDLGGGWSCIFYTLLREELL